MIEALEAIQEMWRLQHRAQHQPHTGLEAAGRSSLIEERLQQLHVSVG